MCDFLSTVAILTVVPSLIRCDAKGHGRVSDTVTNV